MVCGRATAGKEKDYPYNGRGGLGSDRRDKPGGSSQRKRP